jgi:hypothetical protein
MEQNTPIYGGLMWETIAHDRILTGVFMVCAAYVVAKVFEHMP